jgi:hypothetical protein
MSVVDEYFASSRRGLVKFSHDEIYVAKFGCVVGHLAPKSDSNIHLHLSCCLRFEE